MGKTMTPERFQSRDIKRRLSALERNAEHAKADFYRLSAMTQAVRADLKHILDRFAISKEDED